MKILHLLAFGITIYASNKNISNQTTTNNIEIPKHDIKIMGSPKQATNHIFNNIESFNNLNISTTTNEEEINTVLNTAFFTFFKRAVSFFLYNITILKPVFTSIYDKQNTAKTNVKELKELLFKCITVFKVHAIRQLFENDSNTEKSSQEYLMQCCRGYLHPMDIPCENLSLKKLKKKVYDTDQRFFLTPALFSLEFNKINRRTLNSLEFFSTLHHKDAAIVLYLCSIIHDLVSNFHLTIQHPLNFNFYPPLENCTTLFEWAIDILAQLSCASISKNFSNEFSSGFHFYSPDLQLISGFIISLFKIVQANQTNRVFGYDLFSFIQNSLSNSIENSAITDQNILKNNTVKVLTNIFSQFLNEVVKKRNELKEIENQNNNFFVFEQMNPIVDEFFRALIREFGNISVFTDQNKVQ